MRNRRFFLTQIVKLLLQSILYILLFSAFFGFQSISNPQILNLSRTAVTTMVAFCLSTLTLSAVYGGFDIGIRKRRSVLSSMSLTFFFTDIVTYLFLQIMNVNPQNPEANQRLMLWGEDFLWLIAAIAVQLVLIYLFVTIGHRLYYRINPPQRSLIITSSQELANQVARKLESYRARYQLCEVIHYECPDVKKTILEHEVIFLAGIPDTEEGLLEAYCYKHHRSIYLMAELEDVIISTAESAILDDMPFLSIHRVEPTIMQRFFKRLIDIVCSLSGLIITSPILLITALLIKLTDNGSVFFRQKRATIDGKVFEIVKFRTMYEQDRDVEQYSAQKDDARVTPLGNFLRKYRIDELPQLYNVLKGEMSMVGPRPEMLENVDKYTREVPEFRYRQQMKAGLTGLAQIEGKYNTSPKDKAMLDLLYIEQFSLAQDFKLMLRTLTVFFRRDSTEGFGEVTSNCPKMRVTAKERPESSVPAKANGVPKKDETPMRTAL
ncbi:MAG: sugar transferase [Clostridiales bacterium]|nr:sugar transferase [Clostridiales bacterium]